MQGAAPTMIISKITIEHRLKEFSVLWISIECLGNSFKKFHGKYKEKYQRSVKDCQCI